MAQFTFGQVEAVCASLNRIADDKRVAFVSRMKQLQKQGLTEQESRPGRGKAGTYSFGSLMRFVIALELIQAGLMPQMAARLVVGSWGILRANIFVCSFAPEETIGFRKKPTEYLWMLHVEALRGLTREGEGEHDHHDRIMAVPIERAAEQLAKGVDEHPLFFGEGWRTLVLNGYNLTQQVMNLVAFHFGYATRAELRDDIEGEMISESDRYREVSESFKNMPQLTPEQAEKMRRDFAAFDEMDFRSNPPTPRHVLVERAKELLTLMPNRLKEALASRFTVQPTGAVHFAMETEEDRETLMSLVQFDVMTISDVETSEGVVRGWEFTPFGKVLCKELGGPLADWFAGARERELMALRPHEEEADAIIEKLTPEQREAIRLNENIFVEPFHTEMKALGVIEDVEADPPFQRGAKWTDVGREVLMAIRFNRFRNAFERHVDSDSQEATDGNGTEA